MRIETTDYLTLVEAAARLGLSKERVRQLVQAGTLTGIKLGQRWFVAIASLNAYAQGYRG